MNRYILPASLALIVLTADARAADWLQFRGNSANSNATGEDLPVELSGETIAWQTDLPGQGLSQPIIVGGQVIVTASSGYAEDRLHVLSIDPATGSVQWERQFQATGRTVCHETSAVAAPTPASDGKRIFALYSSNDLICLDLTGGLQWYRGLGSEFPNASNSLGMASSPVVIDGTVIAQVESDAEAFAIGIDAETGDTKWKIDRPRRSNWSSPAILPTSDGRPTLALLQGSSGVVAVDPETGSTVWEYDSGASTTSSATVLDGTIVVPSNGLTTLKPQGTTFEQLWNASNLSPSTNSPVAADGMTFSINGGGVLSAGDLATGERLWQVRLKDRFSSTPLVSNGHLFAFNEGGVAFVVKVTREEGQIISQLDLAEKILSSPAAADGALYIRSDAHLWKFAKP